jgi:hypothetical protein
MVRCVLPPRQRPAPGCVIDARRAPNPPNPRTPSPRQAHTRKDAKYSLKASYVEIYNEGVYDLVHFNKKSLPVKWDAAYGFYVQVRVGWGDQACGGRRQGGLELELLAAPCLHPISSPAKQTGPHIRT